MFSAGKSQSVSGQCKEESVSRRSVEGRVSQYMVSAKKGQSVSGQYREESVSKRSVQGRVSQ